MGSSGITLKELPVSDNKEPDFFPSTVLLKTTKIFRENIAILFKVPMIWQNNNGKNYGKVGNKENKQIEICIYSEGICHFQQH